MQDSTLPSAPNKLISSALGQVGRIHFTRSILTQSVLSLPCAICNMAFIQAVIRVLVHCEGSIRSHSIHTHCFIYLNVWLLTHTSPVLFPGRQINCCCCTWMRCFAKHRHKYMRIRKFHTVTCLTDWENLKRSGGHGWMESHTGSRRLEFVPSETKCHRPFSQHNHIVTCCFMLTMHYKDYVPMCFGRGVMVLFFLYLGVFKF